MLLPADLRDLVPKNVDVTPQRVHACKLLIAQWCVGIQNSQYLIDRVATHYGVTALPVIPLYPGADPLPLIRQTSEHILGAFPQSRPLSRF